MQNIVIVSSIKVEVLAEVRGKENLVYLWLFKNLINAAYIFKVFK